MWWKIRKDHKIRNKREKYRTSIIIQSWHLAKRCQPYLWVWRSRSFRYCTIIIWNTKIDHLSKNRQQLLIKWNEAPGSWLYWYDQHDRSIQGYVRAIIRTGTYDQFQNDQWFQNFRSPCDHRNRKYKKSWSVKTFCERKKHTSSDHYKDVVCCCKTISLQWDIFRSCCRRWNFCIKNKTDHWPWISASRSRSFRKNTSKRYGIIPRNEWTIRIHRFYEHCRQANNSTKTIYWRYFDRCNEES